MIMYTLYNYVGGLHEIDRAYNENDIVGTIEEYINGNSTINFLIMFHTQEEDVIYKTIRNKEEFTKYKEEVIERGKIDERNKNKSRKI